MGPYQQQPRYMFTGGKMGRNTCLSALVIAVAAAATSPVMAEEITLNVLLERHTEALGGRGAIDGIRSIVSTGEVEMASTGMKGTIRSVTLMPCLSYTEAALGLFTVKQGFDGEKIWMVGPNGMLQVKRDEDSRRNQVTTCLLEHFGYLSQDDVSTLEYSGTADIDSSRCYVVGFDPAGGYPGRIYIDSSSFLIKMLEIETLTGTVEQRFHEYRETGGVMIPFRTVTIQKMIGQALEVRALTVEINSQVDPAVFLPPGDLVDDFSFVSGGDSATIGFFYVNRHIYLPVRLENGGPERLFLLDSGAGMTMIDEDLAGALGLEAGGKIPGAGAGGMTDFSMTRIPGFRTGDIEFEEQTAIIYAIAGLTGRYSGIETGGVLGYDFLSRFVTRIDYEKNAITFFRPGTQPRIEGADTLQAPLLHKIFSTGAILEGGLEGTFFIDTGANASILQKVFADANGLLDGKKSVEIVVAGAGGEDRAEVARFESIRLGETELAGPVFTIPLGGKGIGAFEGIAGVIGNDLLERFTVWLDYGNQLAVLRPNGSASDPFWPDRSGMQIAADERGDLVVRIIIPGTPAARAGILPGDMLEKVGDVEADGENIGRILSILRGDAGDRVEVEFRRGERDPGGDGDGEKKSATLELESYI
jgi:predicted aspartyl protease